MNDADWLRKHLRGKVQRARAKLPQGQASAAPPDPQALSERLKRRVHRAVERLGRRPKDPEN
ncbi:MAG: hypothetical protein VX899_15455 [Myxococcota bacterium]|nr:hypothetical protein [Myxococcota bacterium]